MALVLALLALFLLTPFAEAAIVVNLSNSMKQVEGRAVSSSVLTFPGTATAGQLLLPGGQVFDNSVTQAISSTCSTGSWATGRVDSASTIQSGYVAWAIATSTSASCVVTLNMSGASEVSWGVVTASVINTSTPLDTLGAGSQAASGFNQSTTVTTTTVNALIVGTMTTAYETSLGTVTLTAPAGWTTILEEENVGFYAPFNFAYQIVTTATTYTGTWTKSDNGQWIAIMASFREATATTGEAPGGLNRHRSSR